MKLRDLIDIKDFIPPIEISNIAIDSRKVQKNTLFFSVNGDIKKSCNYIRNAEEKGAAAVIIKKGQFFPKISIPIYQVDNVRYSLAIAASRIFRYQPKNIVAVTGTSGKTSVSSILQQIWYKIGFLSGSIGTLGAISSKYFRNLSLTTPDPIEIHKILKIFFKKNITHTVIEASSHGLDQNRLDGVNFSAAALTNIRRDHMDYHISFESYYHAKMRLFNSLLPKNIPAIIYTDGEFSESVASYIKSTGRKVFTVGYQGNFICIKKIQNTCSYQNVELKYNNELFRIKFPIFGEFQVYNAAVAAGLAIVVGGASPSKVFHALETVKNIPGRLEFVDMYNGAKIYLDYAHKPDALENVLKTIRYITLNRIILVFGCGGNRDKGKRRIMGKIAEDLSDVVIVTDDNPRTENPYQIRQQILSSAKNAIEISDRRSAIQKGISILQKGDTLIIAGKGRETNQIFNKKKVYFSDFDEIKLFVKAMSL